MGAGALDELEWQATNPGRRDSATPRQMDRKGREGMVTSTLPCLAGRGQEMGWFQGTPTETLDRGVIKLLIY